MVNLDESAEKVDVLNDIAKVYVQIDFEQSLEYALMAEHMAKKIEYRKGEYFACKNAAFVYTNYYLNYYEATNYLSRSLVIAEDLRLNDQLISIYRSFGFVKYSMGDSESGISYYNKAVRIAQQRNDYESLADLYNYMADIYYENGDEKSAFDYFSRVYSLYESGKLDEDEKPYIALGMYYRLNGEFETAEEIYVEAIEFFSINRKPRFEAYAYSQLAETYILLGEYYKAIDATKDGLAIANALNLSKEKMDNYQVQIAIYDSLSDYKKTYTALIKYTRFKDSLNSSQFEEQNQKYQSNYERMVNENKIAQLNEEKINHELELENQRLNRNLIIGLLAFAVVLVLLMILRLRYINKKEKELRVLSLATNYTTNSIVIFDKEIKVEWVNQGFEKLTGLKLGDVKGKYFLDFYNGPELPIQKRDQLTKNFESGEVFTMELSSFHRENDDAYWISFSVTPLLNDQNEITNYVSVASDITEIHNAQLELQNSHDRTILLNEIGKQITSTLSVIEIIEKVYENVNKLMDAQNLGIGIYREETFDLHFPEPIESGNKLNSFNYDLNDKGRIATKCFLNSEEIVVGTMEERLAVTGADPSPLAGEQPNSIIYIPLIAKYKTMGVLSVQTLAENAYGDRELTIVRSLANYIAIALDNAGLYENMEERVEERTKEVRLQKEELQSNYENTKLLSKLGVEISASLEFEEIFEALYESVAKLMDAEIFGVRLYHQDMNAIEYKYEFENGERDPVEFISMDDKDNYTVWCVENDQTILLNDNLNEYHKYVNAIKVPSGEMPNSLIFCPMHGDGKVIGVLTVQSFKKHAYTSYHLDLVNTLASYTGAAINNAALYDTLEQKVEERTIQLEEKNKDIMSSINYAKRIQNGILPSSSFMSQLLPNSFVFYRPRDIVSGDFYWVERSAGKVFFAVVDCTGHGVPGALMSIIGKNILDQAVNEKGLDDPSMILAFLRAGLRFAFSADADDSSNEIEDGMDLGICIWDKESQSIEFAGANINLHVVRDNELTVIKGDKSGVSASDFAIKHFECHSMDVFENDLIYISSDGYPDQFGGERTKKFSQRQFHELLASLANVPFEEQHSKIEVAFDNWKGENNQLDDVCVMGVKI